MKRTGKNNDIFIHVESEHNINMNNNEQLNDSSLETAKKNMLIKAIRNHTKLISEIEYFPDNDTIRFDLLLDVVIVDRSRYNRLLEAEQLYLGSSNYNKKPNISI